MAREVYEAGEILGTSDLEAAIPRCVCQEPTHDVKARDGDRPISEANRSCALMERKGLMRQVTGIDSVLAREAKAGYVS